MTDSKGYCMVLSTVENREQAGELAETLLNKRLAACVQLVDITSIYWWDKQLERGKEVLLRIKTRQALYTKIEGFLEKEHPYSVPQIVKIPLDGGLPSYLEWISENTR